MSAIRTHICLACNINQEEGDGYCDYCGISLVSLRYCTQCKLLCPSGKFCHKCGIQLPIIPVSSEAQSLSRKQDESQEAMEPKQSQSTSLKESNTLSKSKSIPITSPKIKPKSTTLSNPTSQQAAKESISLVSRFINKLKQHSDLISVGVGIFGIGLAIYFYFVPQQAANPAYLISEERSLIFDSTSSPNIKVLDQDDIEIKEDIYLATVTFWNAGNQSIKAEDVIKPVRLHISSIKKILDYSIVEKKDEDIADFKLNIVSEPSEKSENAKIEISWRHLGEDFAVKVQIIYIGDKDAEISFSGYIDGVDGFTHDNYNIYQYIVVLNSEMIIFLLLSNLSFFI